MKKKKSGVLFFDVDGVVCTDRAYYAYGQDKTKTIMRSWDPISLKLVDQLCQDYNLKVVISSTWRIRYDVPLIMLTQGFTSDFHDDDKTPQLFSGNRGMEIREWLDKHPEVDRYIIIDDSEDGLVGNELTPHHCKTSLYDGFLSLHYIRAKQILDAQQTRKLSKKDLCESCGIYAKEDGKDCSGCEAYKEHQK